MLNRPYVFSGHCLANPRGHVTRSAVSQARGKYVTHLPSRHTNLWPRRTQLLSSLYGFGCFDSSISRPSLQDQTRAYASNTPSGPVQNVAVLGGGITGLASAYYLSKEFPNAKITVFEGKPELGGWIKSRKVDVGDGEVIFESGPRSLRPAAPNGTLALRLVQELGLTPDILITPKSAPAARNRFIYYPDHLVRMPGPGQSLLDVFNTVWSEPVFDGAIRAIFNDIGTLTRTDDLLDESVGSFISRRGHKNLANNLASALFHGIYAGDIWQLSVRSILPMLWKREKKHGDLVTAAMSTLVSKASWNFCDDVELQRQLQTTEWDKHLREKILDCSVFTFRRGVGQLAEQLEHRLSNHAYVNLMRGTQVTSVDNGDGSEVKISYQAASESTTTSFTHVISTLSPNLLVNLIPEETRKPTYPTSSSLSKHLNSIPAVTVTVVNLYYRTPALLRTLNIPGGLPSSLQTSGTGLQGFGYLIPNSVPFAQNPERALGVIFDSDISPDLHTTIPADGLGTRLTVMLGGHWWDGWTSYPSDSDAEEMAKSVLARHLGITESPAAVRATLQRNCIPQYVVGHEERMGRAHEALLAAFGGRVRVAGSWFTGVGVNDCLRAAWEVVQGLGARAVVPGGNPGGESRTGLERFAWGRPMALCRRAREGELEIVEVEELGRRMGYFEGVRVEGR